MLDGLYFDWRPITGWVLCRFVPGPALFDIFIIGLKEATLIRFVVGGK